MKAVKQFFGMAFGCLVVLPLLLIVAVTTPLWSPIHWLIFKWGERREIQRMKQAGRFIDWQELQTTSCQGKDGTLIFETAQKAGVRLWWTADDIKTISPHPLPDEEEIDYVFGEDSLFMKWMRESYTGPEGKALRTEHAVTHAPGFPKIADFEPTGFKNVVPAVLWVW